MTAYGSMRPQTLTLGNLRDIEIGDNIKDHANDGKQFVLRYRHLETKFIVEAAKAQGLRPHEHEPDTLAALFDIDDTVFEIKATENTNPFGFAFNALTKDFTAYPINKNLNELLQQTPRGGILDNNPCVVIYDSEAKTWKLYDLYAFLPQPRPIHCQIHLYAATMKTILETNNINVEKIFNSGALHLSYTASKDCELKYDKTLNELCVYGANGVLTLEAINQDMTDNIIMQTSGTIIMEMIVNDTQGAKVKLIDNVKYITAKHSKVYIIIFIQKQSNRIEVQSRGNIQLFYEQSNNINIEKIYLKDSALIDFKLFNIHLTQKEIDSII